MRVNLNEKDKHYRTRNSLSSSIAAFREDCINYVGIPFIDNEGFNIYYYFMVSSGGKIYDIITELQKWEKQ